MNRTVGCELDATALAPRSTLVRIATGRDAADTAVADDGLPEDDVKRLVVLG